MNTTIIIHYIEFLSWYYFEEYCYATENIYFIKHLLPTIIANNYVTIFVSYDVQVIKFHSSVISNIKY